MVLLSICFLLVSLALVTFASSDATPYDPFRILAVHAPRPAEPLVCHLKPLSVSDTVEGDVILSFEEWKAKQIVMETHAKAKADKRPANRSAQGPGAVSAAPDTGNGSNTLLDIVLEDPPSSHPLPVATTQNLADSQQSGNLSPHFRVPLTDRFNYASLDCSARVHTSHRSAKSPSAILSHKRDKYMLSPCVSPKAEPQFVVVELCDDIRIDTVQLANFEFFSGVFKDFTVSVAKTYTTDPAGWTKAGSYKAKNVRGVQSFHPPISLRDFYRLIRIDFLSFYGNEYYCPVSLLRVYGLTHLEEWKWGVWEAESGTKQGEAEVPAPPVVIEAAASPTKTVEAHIVRDSVSPTSAGISPSFVTATEFQLADSETPSTSHAESSIATSSSHDSEPSSPTPSFVPDLLEECSPTSCLDLFVTPSTCQSQRSGEYTQYLASTLVTTDLDGPSNDIGRSLTPTPLMSAGSMHMQELMAGSGGLTPTPLSSGSPSSLSHAIETPIEFPTIITTADDDHTPSLSSSVHIPSTPVHHPHPPISTGGESIYRTIMNRLNALEANHTLYIRYIEEQTNSVRDVLKRLGEDLGRVEAIGKAQAQVFQRTLQDWERQRNRLDMQYGELLSRVDHLAAEVILEKRLGIAQLCLLLVVLLCMGLTRGEARLELPPQSSNLQSSVREWGRRNLSFGNSWVGRLTSRSRNNSSTRKPTSIHLTGSVDFPVLKDTPRIVRTAPLRPSKRLNVDWPTPGLATAGAGGRSGPGLRSRSRTPSSRTPIVHQHALDIRYRQLPATPKSIHAWPLQKSNSHGEGRRDFTFGSGGSVPRSARRSARTAHLHEVRGTAGRTRKSDATARPDVKHAQQENVDVFGTVVPTTAKNTDDRGKVPPEGQRPNPKETEESVEEDAWVDTDVDVDNSEVEVDGF